MNAKSIIFGIVICCLLLSSSMWAQATMPNTNYDVHKEYDEHGNLIYYDSSVVTTWHSDTLWHEADSVITSWENNPDTFMNQYSSHPNVLDELFESFPSLNLDLYHNEISDIMNEVHRNISSIDIDAHIKEMDRVFQKMHDDIMKEFRNSPGDAPANDSIRSIQPQPEDDILDDNTINI